MDDISFSDDDDGTDFVCVTTEAYHLEANKSDPMLGFIF